MRGRRRMEESALGDHSRNRAPVPKGFAAQAAKICNYEILHEEVAS
jgi:hypothetical protein